MSRAAIKRVHLGLLEEQNFYLSAWMMLRYRYNVPIVSCIKPNSSENRACQPVSGLADSGILTLRSHIPTPEEHNSH